MAASMLRRVGAWVITLSLLMPVACDATPLLVNRTHPLQPRNFISASLNQPAVSVLARISGHDEALLDTTAGLQLTQMFKSAAQANISLVLASGYRPYNLQQRLYYEAVETSHAQTLVAPPGYSEHQTGLAADLITSDGLCPAQGCFALTRAADWLAKNANRYGFIIRYPPYDTPSTGYAYEPWHVRYVGNATAKQMYTSHQTLEQYASHASASP